MKEKVLEILNITRDNPIDLETIYRKSGYTNYSKEDFLNVINELVEEKKITCANSKLNLYKLNPYREGIFHIKRNGDCYVNIGDRDITINKDFTYGSMDKDKVLVKITNYDTNTGTIKEIIERELARGGQVFYLHNRIESLPALELKLKKSIKMAKIAIAHGKLNADEMDEVMESFIQGETNILLCTTVIENGIDIPNVNTIIVENADCFGLSQLYQIRGRVGRSDRLAYAYLFYKSSKNLSEIAKKRLSTIKEFANLGSGYKVAMRDLITRGAGDLLGAEQSGFIESVGMDMYIEMLHDAIEQQKSGEIKQEEMKPHTTLNIDAYIPQGFFNNDYEKIELYKQIDKIDKIDKLNELKEEVIDKAGKLPESMRLLFEKKIIDIFEKEGIIESYQENEKEIILKLSKQFSNYRGVGVDIFELASKISTSIILKFPNMRIEAHIKKIDKWLYIVSDFIKGLVKINQKYKGE